MDKFDKVLRDNLKDGKKKAPDFLWDNIEKEIAPKRKRRWFFILFGLVGLLLMLGGIEAFNYFFSPGDTLKKVMTEQLPVSAQDSSAQPFTPSENQVNHPSRTATETEVNQADSTDVNPLINANKPVSPPNQITKKQTIHDRSQQTNASLNQRPKPTSIAPAQTPSTPQEVAVHTVEEAYAQKQQGTVPATPKSELGKIGESSLENNTNEERLSNNQTKSSFETASPIQDSSFLETEKITLADSLQGAETIGVPNDTLVRDSSAIFATAEQDRIRTVDSTATDLRAPEESQIGKRRRFFLEAKAGYSAFQMSVWDESFLVGALSGRPFPSRGYNFNLEVGYDFHRWFQPILGFNYNYKRISFIYDALYDDHGYLTYDIRNNAIPLDNINDEDHLCNRYILEDIEAELGIRSYALTIGNRMNLFQEQKLGLDLDLKYSLTIQSSVQLLDTLGKIDVSGYLDQSFTSRLGTGLNLHYRLNERTKLFLYPEYVFMPRAFGQVIYRGRVHELITSAGIRVYF